MLHANSMIRASVITITADDSHWRYIVAPSLLHLLYMGFGITEGTPPSSLSARRSSIELAAGKEALTNIQPDSPPSPETTRHSCLAAGSTLAI
ncbi:hypothetical protein RRF57_005492 [Xylaria bambusicola]|uniref:Uncharacterized protein n=1 Tax=Xylaria bambusicola TaxID=326684 RepID=A0AAN7Z4U5_9PEZI